MIHPILLVVITFSVVFIGIILASKIIKIYKKGRKLADILNAECVFRIIERDNYHIKFQCIVCSRIDTFYNLEARAE